VQVKPGRPSSPHPRPQSRRRPPDEACLGDAVGRPFGDTPYAAHRRDVDDRASSPLDHLRDRSPHHQECTRQVDFERFAPPIRVKVGNSAHRVDPCVVHEDVETTGKTQRGGDHPLRIAEFSNTARTCHSGARGKCRKSLGTRRIFETS
jgi:hypothetical protein